MPRKKELQPHSERSLSTKGLYLEIASELIADRTTFVKNSLSQMKIENSALYSGLVQTSISLPNRDLAIDWALTYYELTARPTRNPDDTSSMTQVSGDTIDVILSLKTRMLKPLSDRYSGYEDQESPEAIETRLEMAEVLRDMDEQKALLHEADSKKSPEHAAFWSTFYLQRAQYNMSGNEARHEFSSVLIDFVVQCLHEQEIRNRFRSNFPQI